MSAKVEKLHIGWTAILLLLLALTVLIITGWVLNQEFDGVLVVPINNATGSNLFFSLISGVCTVAAAIVGLFHVWHFKAGSLAAASALSLLAWLFSVVTLGFSSKQIALGGGVNDKLATLAILDIVVAAFLTLYVVLLHGGLFDSSFGAGY